MTRLSSLLTLVIALTAIGGCMGECPFTVMGPCQCHDDPDGVPTLRCEKVAGWEEISDVFANAGVSHYSSVNIMYSPQVTELPPSAFADITFNALRFYDTGLLFVDPISFSETTASQLQHLYIKYNSELTSLNSALPGHFPVLEAMYISNNKIDILSGALDSTGLTYLDLAHNGLQQIAEDYFSAASALEVLLLPSNELTTEGLKPGSLTINNAGDDLYINLAWNHLTEGVPLSAFGGQIPKELILSNNNINTLSLESFEPLLTAMHTSHPQGAYILLDHNALDCSCTMSWITEHEGRHLLEQAECEDGRLVSGLTSGDFSEC